MLDIFISPKFTGQRMEVFHNTFLQCKSSSALIIKVLSTNITLLKALKKRRLSGKNKSKRHSLNGLFVFQMVGQQTNSKCMYRNMHAIDNYMSWKIRHLFTCLCVLELTTFTFTVFLKNNGCLLCV